MDADVIVVGGGLAGLVAACEVIDAKRKVILLDQEPDQSLGGQAFWSLGGLLFVDSPEQRRMRIRDSYELALQDWMGTACFDRAEDTWPRKWAEAYVAFAAGEKRAWLRERGMRWFPVVGWAERGGNTATGHGNSVPRFHVTWGTGPGVIAPFVKRVREGIKKGLVSFRPRHRVTGLVVEGGSITGVRGEVLEPSTVARGQKSSRTIVGEFALKAQAIVVTSGGIGGNHELVRRNWPQRLGTPPAHMVCGVPDHVDGRMQGIVEDAGANLNVLRVLGLVHQAVKSRVMVPLVVIRASAGVEQVEEGVGIIVIGAPRGPAQREIEQVGLGERAHDGLGNDRKPDPCRKRAAAKQHQMRDPHRPQHQHANETELDRHGERLLMRIGRDGRVGAGLTGGLQAELLRDRAGAVAEHRRGGDTLQRLLPELESFAGRAGRVSFPIDVDLGSQLNRALAQIGRRGP